MNRDIMEFYERLRRWVMYNARYLRRPPWDTGISPPELLEFVRDHPAGRAIDLGCGTGLNVLALAKAGWQATGVDFAPRAVVQARRRLRVANIKADLHLGDVTRLEGIVPPFDLVLDIGCLHALSDQGRVAYIRNLPGLLAPGGTFLLYAHRKGVEGAAFTGLSEAEIDGLSAVLKLVKRKDSLDSQRREAVWLIFTKAV